MGAEDIPDEEEENADDLSIASMETVDEIRNEDATQLLTKYADLKLKEVETLQEMVAVINSEELNPKQCYQIVKEVSQAESQIPEMKQVSEEFDYESI